MRTRHLITNTLVAANIAVFGISILYNSHTQLIGSYGFSLEAIQNGFYAAFITAGFLHANLSHLLYNMLFLTIYGHATEEELGHLKTLTIYLTGMVAGSIFFALLFPAQTAVGASGAVFALIAASMLIEPGRPIHDTLPLPIGLIAVAYILPAIANAFNLSAGIANIAHVGGAIAGALLAFHWEPERARNGLVAVIGFSLLALGLGAI